MSQLTMVATRELKDAVQKIKKAPVFDHAENHDGTVWDLYVEGDDDSAVILRADIQKTNGLSPDGLKAVAVLVILPGEDAPSVVFDQEDIRFERFTLYEHAIRMLSRDRHMDEVWRLRSQEVD